MDDGEGMKQIPCCDDYLLRWKGDILVVTLALGASRAGRAAFRTDIGGEWTDIPMRETSSGVFCAEVSLDRIGIFAGKCCFFPEGSSIPEWPQGGNFRVKVEPAATRAANSIYTVFPRQFGSFREVSRRRKARRQSAERHRQHCLELHVVSSFYVCDRCITSVAKIIHPTSLH